MSDELKLLPCPFCYDGGIDTHEPHPYGFGEGTIYHDNPTCPAQGYHAVAAWNRRATPAPLAPEVRGALEEAAQSLETISRCAGRDEYMDDMENVRAYARSRAEAARAALQSVFDQFATPTPPVKGLTPGEAK